MYNAQLQVVHEGLNSSKKEIDELDESTPQNLNAYPIYSLSSKNNEIDSQQTTFYSEMAHRIEENLQYNQKQAEARWKHTQGQTDNDLSQKEKPVIKMNHLLSALETTKPSTSAKDRLKFEQIYSQFTQSKKKSNENVKWGKQTLA